MQRCWRGWKKAQSMTDRALGLLGLGKRAGTVQAGEMPVQKACRSGHVRLLAVSCDAGEHTIRSAKNWSKAPLLPLPWSKQELGTALGIRTCALLAVTDAGLALAFAEKLSGDHSEVIERLKQAVHPTK